jgi:hypothetical protein
MIKKKVFNTEMQKPYIVQPSRKDKISTSFFFFFFFFLFFFFFPLLNEDK